MYNRNVDPYIALLCREGPDADSGRVSLDDPVNCPNILWRHAQTGAHATHCAIG